jgi:hypothetical protein
VHQDKLALRLSHVLSLMVTRFYFAPPTPITIAEYFLPKPSYDVAQDLTPVALIGRNPAVIVVPSSVPAQNLAEFFALAKKDPSKVFLWIAWFRTCIPLNN